MILSILEITRNLEDGENDIYVALGGAAVKLSKWATQFKCMAGTRR